MSKNRDKELTDFTAHEEAVVEAPRVVFVETPKTLTFEQWAARRKFKSHHLRGIRAHVIDADRARPFEDWERAAQGY